MARLWIAIVNAHTDPPLTFYLVLKNVSKLFCKRGATDNCSHCQTHHRLGIASNLVASGCKSEVIPHVTDFVHPQIKLQFFYCPLLKFVYALSSTVRPLLLNRPD